MSDKHQLAEQIVRTLRAARQTAYFAGGCVRDMLRGVTPHDYDIVTSATPEAIRALFPRTFAVGIQFGVVIVVIDSENFEVATFRSDDAYLDGRRPISVTFSNPEADAQRRDFTINGLFYDPVDDQVLDFVNGRADLERRLIRCIGAPAARFAEDKLRMLRAIRFTASLDFEIDPATLAAIQKFAPEITAVSNERIREELVRMFTGPHPGRALRLLDASGLLAQVLPKVAEMKGVEQPAEFHPEGDVFVHTCLMMDALSHPSVTLAFGVLLHDVGKPKTFVRAPDRIRFNEHDSVGADLAEEILRQLRFSNEELKRIVACVANHMRFRHATEMRKSKLKHLLTRPTFAEELELHRLDCLSSHGDLTNYDFLRKLQQETPPEVSAPPPLISGSDLLALGLSPGPTVGKLLAEARLLQLDEKLISREAALDWARQQTATAGRSTSNPRNTTSRPGPAGHESSPA